MADALDELIHRADLDGLVRYVDDTCSDRDWEHLVSVRDKSRAAVNTGRQLWPIATLANYRLALWAPARHAVRALDDTARTFMPGPVSEILAVNHRWSDVEPFLDPGHDRSLVAYERAIRGDIISEHEEKMLEIPFAVASWEPRYTSTQYNDDGVIDKKPSISKQWHSCSTRRGEIVEDDTVYAFRRMMEPWTSQSNGMAQAVVVEGELEEAFDALQLHNVEFSQISSAEAIDLLAWAASTGGAHGKRRGLATGRSEALWLLSVFTGLDESWPRTFDELGEVMSGLEFFTYRASENSDSGWSVHIAIVDPEEGVAVALSAHDLV